MKELLEQFCQAALKAGYAAAEVRISGCVVCTMPKGLDNKAAADLFNATPGLLAKNGLRGSIRCLPSDAGRAVVAQDLRPLPKVAAPAAKAEASASDATASEQSDTADESAPVAHKQAPKQAPKGNKKK